MSIVPLDDAQLVDLAQLDIHPLPAPLSPGARSAVGPGPLSGAVGKGNAFMSISPSIVNQNTSYAFGMLTSGWTPGEMVQLYVNGGPAGTYDTDGVGRLALHHNTGAGFGYLTFEQVGLTSGNRTGGVAQVSATGPYLAGVAAAPHAVNTAASDFLYLLGTGYPPSTTVNLYRNGVFITTFPTNAFGYFYVAMTPANNGNTSAVHSADMTLMPDAVTNDGFETGALSPWVADDTSPAPAVSTVQKHAGTYSVHLGNPPGPDAPGFSSVYQTITVPRGGGMLSYWYWPRTADYDIVFDWQDAYVTDTSGTILATIMHVLSNAQAWTQVTFDMSPYAGQTVRIKFLVRNDGYEGGTDMFVDDVSLLWSTSQVGQSVEERSDAGTPPSGDQNIARAFFDPSVKNSATGGGFSFVGEGFQPGESVTMSDCASLTRTASANGAVGIPLFSNPGVGLYYCTLTGVTSGRVARASALQHPNVTNLRSMIVAPALVAPGGSVTVLLSGLTPSDTGTVDLDGVSQGTATVNAIGLASFLLTKPVSGFVHEVGWTGTGGVDRQSSVLLLVLPAFAENFDGVAAPALPAGWTTEISGAGLAWTTVTTSPVDTAPNTAFGPEAAAVGLTSLTSPIIAVPAGGVSQLRFRNLYNLEKTGTCWDGMVLEINIGANGGGFADILTAGGSFVSGGYVGCTISNLYGNPLVGRNAWSGVSAGTTAAPAYITTLVNLPPAATGQNIQLRWSVGTDSDNSVAVGTLGARIDTITLDRPPAVVTGVASGIMLGAATLNGTVNPDGTMTTGYFDYGPTLSYGSTTPVQTLGAGNASLAIGGGSLTGLSCGLYHFRAVAVNAIGTTYGSDATFTVWTGCLFTDNTLISGTTPIKAVHITELRTRIDGVRMAHGLGGYPWVHTITATSTTIMASDVAELRTALDLAYDQIPMTHYGYTRPSIVLGQTILAQDIRDTRLALVAIE